MRKELETTWNILVLVFKNRWQCYLRPPCPQDERSGSRASCISCRSGRASTCHQVTPSLQPVTQTVKIVLRNLTLPKNPFKTPQKNLLSTRTLWLSVAKCALLPAAWRLHSLRYGPETEKKINPTFAALLRCPVKVKQRSKKRYNRCVEGIWNVIYPALSHTVHSKSSILVQAKWFFSTGTGKGCQLENRKSLTTCIQIWVAAPAEMIAAAHRRVQNFTDSNHHRSSLKLVLKSLYSFCMSILMPSGTFAHRKLFTICSKVSFISL